MNKMIACCGINCETCEARIATINNDDKMRIEVAKISCHNLNQTVISKCTSRIPFSGEATAAHSE